VTANSKIEWTHHTFNPWWGCQRVSPGCENCYAEAFAKRTGNAVWGPSADRRFFGDKHWAEPIKWNGQAKKAGERQRVFCASMADVFEDRRDLDEQRDRLWRLIAVTTQLDWLLLTKRPQDLARFLPWSDTAWANVWLGTTVEDRPRMAERLSHLRARPAAVHFLSIEPLLEDLGQINLNGIDWVIVGGESGPKSRPFDLGWARSIQEQCRAAGVAFFMKQMGDASVWPLDDAARSSFRSGRFRLKPKGGDWNEWPDDLRVREFPGALP
jgi:protein gp37